LSEALSFPVETWAGLPDLADGLPRRERSPPLSASGWTNVVGAT
jgi:hypothetical protein